MFKKIIRKNLDIFLKKHSTEIRVLDIGSGGSPYDKFFPNRLTVDIDPLRKPNIVADAEKLPFKDSEFEVVLCTEVLEHVENPQKVLKELQRVLVKGGKLILTTRFVYPIHDSPGDYWRFTKYGLQKLFEGWKIVELQSDTRSFSAIGALLQRISFQSVLRFNKIAKLFILSLAFLFDKLNFLIVEEYGDIKRSKKETNIMSCGYFVVAEKD